MRRNKVRRPGASLEALAARARLLGDIRAFFAARDVLEVDVPALSPAAAVEPHLHSIACDTEHGRRFLHTSPEFGLKRLLAAGSGPIYQLSHVFRNGERGRWHNPEFTMLEWYRPGWDYQRLMDEVAALLAALGVAEPVTRLAFADAFARSTGLCAFTADAAALRGRAQALGLAPPRFPEDGDDARPFWLDLLMGLHVIPELGLSEPCLVYDFPADMAGLTRLRAGSPAVAERFELYWRGVELANGGSELTDAGELARRFRRDLALRRRAGLPELPVDRRLLAALEDGLPDCAGVALGVDRLLALTLGLDGIAAVLPLGAFTNPE